jgi:hypothetical protein
MQIAFACDGKGPPPSPIPAFPTAVANDGQLYEASPGSATDEWYFNGPIGVVDAPPNAGLGVCSRPEAVRITLMARSLGGDSAVTGGAKPAAENGAAGPADTFRHRTLTTTIFPRNNKL